MGLFHGFISTNLTRSCWFSPSCWFDGASLINWDELWPQTQGISQKDPRTGLAIKTSSTTCVQYNCVIWRDGIIWSDHGFGGIMVQYPNYRAIYCVHDPHPHHLWPSLTQEDGSQRMILEFPLKNSRAGLSTWWIFDKMYICIYIYSVFLKWRVPKIVGLKGKILVT